MSQPDPDQPESPAPESQVRRSSIRPVSSDWHPGPRASHRPTPMVVVYAGDSERPPFDPDEPSERTTSIPSEPAAPFPFAQGAQHADRVGRWPAVYEAADYEKPTESVHSERPPAVAAVPVLAPRTRSRSKRLAIPGLLLGVLLVGVLSIRWPEERAELLAASPVPRTGSSEASLTKSFERRLNPAAVPEGPAEAEEPAPGVAASSTIRVTLEVFPADAKVIRRGVRQPGPPFVINVPKGKRIALEVARKGYSTRKVVLDGADPTVVVGLVRKKAKKQ